MNGQIINGQIINGQIMNLMEMNKTEISGQSTMEIYGCKKGKFLLVPKIRNSC